MTTLRDRYRGCLLGGAVGDAPGSGIEFLSLAEIRRRHGPAGVTGYVPAYARAGAITDDTQMTLFTAEDLLRNQQAPPRVRNAFAPGYGPSRGGFARPAFRHRAGAGTTPGPSACA